MIKEFVRVRDAEAVRDLNTGAIVFTDTRAFRQAKLRKYLKEEQKKKDILIQELNSEMATVRKFVNDMLESMRAPKKEADSADTK